MRSLTPRSRWLLEIQGYTDLHKPEFARAAPWLRLAPAAALAWIIWATWTQSAVAFWALVPVAWLGSVLPHHPLDGIYNRLVRPFVQGTRLPRNEAPRRLADATISVMAMLAGMCLYAGASVLGTAVAAVMISAEAVYVVTGFCFMSWVHYRMTRPPPTEDRRRRYWTEGNRRSEPTQPRVFTAEDHAWAAWGYRPRSSSSSARVSRG